MKIYYISFAALLCLTIQSCANNGKFQSDIKKDITSEFLTKSSTLSSENPSDNWWLEFNDEVLNKLVALGLENNKDIQIANLAIVTSRQLNNIDASTLLPSASVGIGRQRFAAPGFGPQGAKYDIYQSTFDAAWELDFLGKNLDRYKAGKLRFLKEAQLYKANALRVASEISQNYIRLKSLQKQIENLAETVVIKKQLIDIANNKEKTGSASKVNIHNAEINFNSASSQLIEAQTNQKILTYKLAVLIGTTPDKILEILSKQSAVEIFDYSSGLVPVGLKSDILRRRPDIIAAEYEIDAAVFDKRSQLKEFFPSFNLTARVGGGAQDLGDVFKNGANVKNIQGMVSVPIFQAGRLMAEYKISKTKAKIAVLDYEKTVLNALEECESQLVRYVNALQIEDNSNRSLQASLKILQINQNKKRLGVISKEDLLNSQVEKLTSEIQMAQKKSDSLVNLIALHKTIGGGFEGYKMRFEKRRVFWEGAK
jgi:NodT family efflux transporter outer membrane factor (OMF) lipoprotein